MELPIQNFDQDFYLAAWPDVRAAVDAGAIPSAYHHWRLHGREEDRAYRVLSSGMVRGSRRPRTDGFADNLDLWSTWPQKEYHHRGISVRCCLADVVRERLAHTVAQLQSAVIVEVGVYGGATLLHLAEMAERLGHRLVGVDPWEKAAPTTIDNEEVADFTRFAAQLRWNIEQAVRMLNYQHVQVVHDFSLGAAPAFADNSIDLVILDGDHGYQAVTDDLAAWWPKIKPGGKLWADDYDHDGVQRAIDQFAERQGLQGELWQRQYIVDKPLDA